MHSYPMAQTKREELLSIFLGNDTDAQTGFLVHIDQAVYPLIVIEAERKASEKYPNDSEKRTEKQQEYLLDPDIRKQVAIQYVSEQYALDQLTEAELNAVLNICSDNSQLINSLYDKFAKAENEDKQRIYFAAIDSLATVRGAASDSIRKKQVQKEQEGLQKLGNALKLPSNKLTQAVKEIDTYLAILKKSTSLSQIETSLQQARDALLESNENPNENMVAFFKALSIPYDPTQSIANQIDAAFDNTRHRVAQHMAMYLLVSSTGDKINRAHLEEIINNIHLIAINKSTVDSAINKLMQQGENYIDAFARDLEEFDSQSLRRAAREALISFCETIGHPASEKKTSETPLETMTRIATTLEQIHEKILVAQISTQIELLHAQHKDPIQDMQTDCQTYLNHLNNLKPNQKTQERIVIVKQASAILQDSKLSDAQKVLSFERHIQKNNTILSKTEDSWGKQFINGLVGFLERFNMVSSWLLDLQKKINAKSDTQDFRTRLAETKKSIDTQKTDSISDKENNPNPDAGNDVNNSNMTPN